MARWWHVGGTWEVGGTLVAAWWQLGGRLVSFDPGFVSVQAMLSPHQLLWVAITSGRDNRDGQPVHMGLLCVGGMTVVCRVDR